MKKVIIYVTLIVVCSVTLSIYLISNHFSDREKNLKETATVIGDVVVGFYQGVDSTSLLEEYGEFFDTTLLTYLNDYNEQLKAQDDGVLNVTEYYQKHLTLEGYSEDEPWSPEFDAGVSADDPEGGMTQEELDLLQQMLDSLGEQEFQEDSRIYYEGDTAFIKLKDLDFSDDSRDIVFYKDTNMIVRKENVPETYQEMIKNSDNIYNYIATVKYDDRGKQYIDVMYRSLKSDSSLIVRSHYYGKKITEIEVKGRWVQD